LARKFIAFAKSHLDATIVPIETLRASGEMAEMGAESIVTRERLEDYDPVHATYVLAQNRLSLFTEQISELAPMRALAEAHAMAKDEYMPGGPPMSPLTTSLFSFWALCDMSTTPSRESFCSVIIEMLKEFAAEHPTEIYEIMRDSRMGLYEVAETLDRFVVLREFVTKREIKAICPSGAEAVPGEIWYARVLPPPLPDPRFDYSVVVTTPYITAVRDARGGITSASSIRGWNRHFQRVLGTRKGGARIAAYEHHMKHGPSRNYWNEFVFLGYVNQLPGAIILEGLPDRPSTLPHSPDYSRPQPASHSEEKEKLSEIIIELTELVLKKSGREISSESAIAATVVASTAWNLTFDPRMSIDNAKSDVSKNLARLGRDNPRLLDGLKSRDPETLLNLATEEIRRSYPDDSRIIISCEHTLQGTLRVSWK
jgi:hypothetical protein